MSSLVATLDHLRAFVLRRTLSIEAIRRVFKSRADRLFFSFLVSAAVSFTLAGAVPLWLIALGPIFLGIPHLFSGFRYLPRLTAPDFGLEGGARVTRLLAGLAFLIALVRLLGASQISVAVAGMPANFWELASLGIFAAFLLARRFASRELACSVALLGPVLYFSWMQPIATALVLGMGHNFIAFVFWIRAAVTRPERARAIWALAIFTVLSGLCLTGWADFAFSTLGLPFPKGLGFDPFVLSAQLVPGIVNPDWAWRGIMAYAFGQSMHYFVWLKAIPEQSVRQQVPLSFQQSRAAARAELGPWLLRIAGVASVGLVLATGFFELDSLRGFYLAISTSHGYLEIAALPFSFAASRAAA